MIRHWFVASCVFAVLSGACSKEDKAPAGTQAKQDESKPDPSAKQDGVADQKQAEKPADPPAPPLQIKASPNGDDLALLPVDSELVLGVNFTQLSQSVVWKQLVEPRLLSDNVKAKLGEFKAKCGFDPMTAVQSISMGLKGVGGDKPDGVMVVHGPEKTKVMACLDKMKDEAAKDGSTVTRDGDIVVVKSKTGETFAFTYVNETTVLGVVGPNANAAGVKAAAAGTSALKSSQAFVDMYSKINTSDSLWILMNGNSKAFEKAAQMGFKPKAVFGSVNVTDGLSVDMRVRLDTPDQAAQITNMANSQTAQFKQMVDKLAIVAEGADVKIDIALSTQKLEALISQFAGMMGGMGGGMGSP